MGQLTELYLPTKGIRFIAINDGADLLAESGTDFNPIRNWANELHAKDISKKVRAVKKMQAERDERLGGRPPFGYRRKTPDSKELRSRGWKNFQCIRPIFRYVSTVGYILSSGCLDSPLQTSLYSNLIPHFSLLAYSAVYRPRVHSTILLKTLLYLHEV